MKKNIIIVLLIIIAVLSGILGWVLGTKSVDKEKESVKENTSAKAGDTKITGIVGTSYSGKASRKLTEEECEESGLDYGVGWVCDVEIPKLLIETETTKKINEKIYNNYKDYIDEIEEFNKQNHNGTDVSDTSFSGLDGSVIIDCDYTIYKDIIFIVVTEAYRNLSAASGDDIKVYYYDIINDKELSVDDVAKILNVKLSDFEDSAAKKLISIIPYRKFEVIAEEDPCNSFHCKLYLDIDAE